MSFVDIRFLTLEEASYGSGACKIEKRTEGKYVTTVRYVSSYERVQAAKNSSDWIGSSSKSQTYGILACPLEQKTSGTSQPGQHQRTILHCTGRLMARSQPVLSMRWPRTIVLVRACSSDLDQTELQQHAAQMLPICAN